MPRYSRRESKNWTLSSTVLGWLLTAAAILIVVFFGGGLYLGYNWGAGVEQPVTPDDQPAVLNEMELSDDRIAELLAGLDEDFLELDSEDLETAATDAEPGVITDEDLGIVVEDEQPTEDRHVERETDPGIQPEVPAEQRPDSPLPGVTEAPEPERAAELDEFYVIQVSSSASIENAEAFADELEAQGYPASIRETVVEGETWYRVRVGEFPNRSQAEQFAGEMVDAGLIDENYWISFVGY